MGKRGIYCNICGDKKEEIDAKQAYCKPCRRIKRKEANAKRREAEGLLPRTHDKTGERSLWCPDCKELKNNPGQAYCKPCRNKRGREWALKTGRVVSNNTGLCPCGAPRAENQPRFCAPCKALDSRKYRFIKGRTDKDRATKKAWNDANKQKVKDRMATDKEFAKKVRTRSETNRHIKNGLLVRQNCEVCGAEKAQAHHDDYDKPMDVRWLCDKHHKEHHANEQKVTT